MILKDVEYLKVFRMGCIFQGNCKQVNEERTGMRQANWF